MTTRALSGLLALALWLALGVAAVYLAIQIAPWVDSL